MSRPHGNHRNTAGGSYNDYNGRHDRSRSKSPQRQSWSASSSSSSSRSRSRSPERRDYRDRPERREEDARRPHAAQRHPGQRPQHQPQSAAPAPSRGFAIGSRSGSGMAPPTINKVLPVQMKLASSKPTETKKKMTVASAFCNDSDDDDDAVEEMPAECRMRMRNIGRDTPTSSGPNSFGKTKQGFCDSQKIIEKNLKSTSGARK